MTLTYGAQLLDCEQDISNAILVILAKAAPYLMHVKSNTLEFLVLFFSDLLLFCYSYERDQAVIQDSCNLSSLNVCQFGAYS